MWGAPAQTPDSRVVPIGLRGCDNWVGLGMRGSATWSRAAATARVRTALRTLLTPSILVEEPLTDGGVLSRPTLHLRETFCQDTTDGVGLAQSPLREG